MPKVYLRMDPNIDQHADFAGMVLLMCAAARQHPRGRFQRNVVVRVLGSKKRAESFTTPRPGKDRPDLVEQPDGTLYLDGWDEWQEGDITVGERVARIRAKRRNQPSTSVTPALLDRSKNVSVRTSAVAVAVAAAVAGDSSLLSLGSEGDGTTTTTLDLKCDRCGSLLRRGTRPKPHLYCWEKRGGCGKQFTIDHFDPAPPTEPTAAEAWWGLHPDGGLGELRDWLESYQDLDESDRDATTRWGGLVGCPVEVLILLRQRLRAAS